MAIDWAAIDELRAGLAVPKLTINQSKRDEVKLVSYDFNQRFPKRINTVELIHLTDLQYGHVNFQRKRFLSYRDWILSAPNRFVLLGGDLIDAATKISVGSPYENTQEPKGQVADCCELLEPLAKAGRLLGYVGGNHERRTIPTFGDVGGLIAEKLQVPYSAGVQLIDIHFGQHSPFKVSLWHGIGSAKTKGAKAQMLHRFMQQHGSQLYLVGHLHDALVIPDWRVERIDGRLHQTKTMGIMSSSFLEYWGSYAETMALPPSDTLMGRAILERNGKWQVTLK